MWWKNKEVRGRDGEIKRTVSKKSSNYGSTGLLDSKSIDDTNEDTPTRRYSSKSVETPRISKTRIDDSYDSRRYINDNGNSVYWREAGLPYTQYSPDNTGAAVYDKRGYYLDDKVNKKTGAYKSSTNDSYENRTLVPNNLTQADGSDFDYENSKMLKTNKGSSRTSASKNRWGKVDPKDMYNWENRDTSYSRYNPTPEVEKMSRGYPFFGEENKNEIWDQYGNYEPKFKNGGNIPMYAMGGDTDPVLTGVTGQNSTYKPTSGFVPQAKVNPTTNTSTTLPVNNNVVENNIYKSPYNHNELNTFKSLQGEIGNVISKDIYNNLDNINTKGKGWMTTLDEFDPENVGKHDPSTLTAAGINPEEYYDAYKYKQEYEDARGRGANTSGNIEGNTPLREQYIGPRHAAHFNTNRGHAQEMTAEIKADSTAAKNFNFINRNGGYLNSYNNGGNIPMYQNGTNNAFMVDYNQDATNSYIGDYDQSGLAAETGSIGELSDGAQKAGAAGDAALTAAATIPSPVQPFAVAAKAGKEVAGAWEDNIKRETDAFGNETDVIAEGKETQGAIAGVLSGGAFSASQNEWKKGNKGRAIYGAINPIAGYSNVKRQIEDEQLELADANTEALADQKDFYRKQSVIGENKERIEERESLQANTSGYESFYGKNGGYAAPQAEIENGEIIEGTTGAFKATGNTHENGGIEISFSENGTPIAGKGGRLTKMYEGGGKMSSSFVSSNNMKVPKDMASRLLKI